MSGPAPRPRVWLATAAAMAVVVLTCLVVPPAGAQDRSDSLLQIASVADDEELAKFLPPNVVHALRARMAKSPL